MTEFEMWVMSHYKEAKWKQSPFTKECLIGPQTKLTLSESRLTDTQHAFVGEEDDSLQEVKNLYSMFRPYMSKHKIRLLIEVLQNELNGGFEKEL